MRVGVIGVGVMGRPMAGRLIAAGHTLFVHDVAAQPGELASQGATVCASGREVAQRAEVVIIMTPDAGALDSPQVEAMLFGPDGVAEGLSRPGAAEPDEDIRSLGYVLRLQAGSCDEAQPA